MDDGLAALLENIIKTPSTYYKLIGFGFFPCVCACVSQQQRNSVKQYIEINVTWPPKSHNTLFLVALGIHMKCPLYSTRGKYFANIFYL